MRIELSSLKITCKYLIILALLIFCVDNIWSLPIDFSDIKDKDGYLTGNMYQVKLIPEPKQYTIAVSMDDLGKEILPGYELKLARMVWWMGREYTFSNPSTKTTGLIRLAVYPTVRKAQESALYYLNSLAVVFTPGTKAGLNIGDSCWYKDSNIKFLRDNVFVVVATSGKDYALAEKISLAIDSALISGTTGVKIGSTSPSLINSIEIPAKLHTGEQTTIRVHPNVFSGKLPKYDFIEGNRGESIRDNITNGELRYKAKNTGKEKMLIYVYDEDCRVSWEVKEIEVVP